MASLAILLSACASDKPVGYGLAPVGAGAVGRMEAAASAAAPGNGSSGSPDSPGMYRSLIERMQSQGLFFASLAHIAQFELQYGVTPDSTLLRARAQRETGQLDLSAEAYRGLVDSERAAAAWHGLGLIAGARGDYAGAANALAEAARRAPTDPLVLNDYGYALLRAGQVVGARLPLAQAAELDAGNPKIVANLAVYLRVTDENARADAVMTRAAMTPVTRTAIVRLADTIRTELAARQSSATISGVALATPVATASQPPAASVVSRAAPQGQAAPLASQGLSQPVAPVSSGSATVVDESPLSARPLQPLLERFGAGAK